MAWADDIRSALASLKGAQNRQERALGDLPDELAEDVRGRLKTSIRHVEQILETLGEGKAPQLRTHTEETPEQRTARLMKRAEQPFRRRTEPAPEPPRTQPLDTAHPWREET